MRQLKSSLSISLLFLLPVAMWAGEKSSSQGESFQFAYGKEPLVYSVYQKSETKAYMSNPSSNLSGAPYANGVPQSSMTKSTAEIRYKFRLTAVGTPKKGVITVHYEPFDFEVDMDSSGASGHFITTVRGLSVKSVQNGITIIDTDKEIGVTQAKTVKNDFVPLLLSGTFEVDDSGALKDFHGDLPFVDVWKEQTKNQIGLFGFQLPDHAVTNGESWQVIVPMKSSGPIKFEGGPLNHTNTFTLLDEDISDPSVASFKVAAPMHCYDLGAYIEERGQSTHADLSEFESHAFGTVHFDRKRRVFLDEDLTRTASLSMTMLIQGRAMSARNEVRTEEQINLLPNYSEKSSGESDAEKPAGHKSL